MTAKKKSVTADSSPTPFGWMIDRGSFVTALKLAGTIVRGSGKIPYLQHVLLASSGSVLTLSVTNLDETVETIVEAELAGFIGKFCLPHAMLSKIVVADPEDTLRIGLVPGQPFSAAITGDGCYSIMGLDPADFPRLPDKGEVGKWGSLPLPAVAEALRRSKPFVGSGKLDLHSALLRYDDNEHFTVFANDGQKMWRQLVRQPGSLPDKEREISVSVSAFDPIAGLYGDLVRVGWSDQRQHLIFDSEDGTTTISFRRSEKTHPDYDSVMRSVLCDDFRCVVIRDELGSAVGRALATASMERVQLVCDGESIEVLSESAEGSTRCRVHLGREGSDGKEWRAQLKGNHLADALAAIDSYGVELLVAAEDCGHPSLTVQPVVSDDGGEPLRTVIIMRQNWGGVGGCKLLSRLPSHGSVGSPVSRLWCGHVSETSGTTSSRSRDRLPRSWLAPRNRRSRQ